MDRELFAKKANAEKKIRVLLEEVKILREEIEKINKEISGEYAKDYYIKKAQSK